MLLGSGNAQMVQMEREYGFQGLWIHNPMFSVPIRNRLGCGTLQAASLQVMMIA